MSVRPGTQIIQRETPPTRSAPTDTGVWLVVGLTEKGAQEPMRIESMSEYGVRFGARVSYGILYDALDTYFHEGGRTAIISRVVGPGATTAHLNLQDGSSGVALVANANSPGDWGNSLKVAVKSPVTAGWRIEVSNASGVLETSPDLTTHQAAIDWSNGQSSYLVITDGISPNDPAQSAPASLAGGLDDRNNVTDNEWQKALNLLVKDLGPGQVSMPGRTTDAAHSQLLIHAGANNRTALLDLPDSATAATLKASVASARVAGNARFGAAFAPWVVVPGYVPGTVRTVPASAYVAGGICRTDSLFDQDTPAAGDNGQALWAIDISQPGWDDATRTDLNANGVDVIRMMYGGVRTYGWRTVVDPNKDPNWINFGNSRLFMAIAADGAVIAERYVLMPIDGNGVLIGQFGGALKGMLLGYFNRGALYGATPDEAFYVDVGPQVNTPDTLSKQELHALISLRMSPFAELVVLEIVKVGITEAVA